MNRKGYVTTPRVRKAVRKLKQARKNAPKAKHDVGGIEDPQIRKAIVRYAPRVENLARQEYGISGEALLSKLVEGESGEQQGAVSSAQAKSITQFIPSTRADFVSRLGVDPWRSKREAVLAATIHLDGRHGYSPGLEGYNPGGGEEYVQHILDQPAGSPVRTGRRSTPALRKAKKEAHKLGLAIGGDESSKRVPKKVMTRYKAALAAAKELDKAKLPYVWGGGHGDSASRPTSGGLDCSGAVGYVLNKIGVMKGSAVSGEMGRFLKPGPGAITVFYNEDHTFMRIGDRYWGTSRSNPAGGPGFIEDPGSLSEYNVGHVPGLGKKVAVALGVSLTDGGSSSFPGMTLSPSGTTATITGDGAKVDKPGFSSKPIRLSPAQKARRKLKRLEQLGVGVGKTEKPERDSGNATLTALERKYGVAT